MSSYKVGDLFTLNRDYVDYTGNELLRITDVREYDNGAIFYSAESCSALIRSIRHEDVILYKPSIYGTV